MNNGYGNNDQNLSEDVIQNNDDGLNEFFIQNNEDMWKRQVFTITNCMMTIHSVDHFPIKGIGIGMIMICVETWFTDRLQPNPTKPFWYSIAIQEIFNSAWNIFVDFCALYFRNLEDLFVGGMEWSGLLEHTFSLCYLDFSGQHIR